MKSDWGLQAFETRWSMETRLGYNLPNSKIGKKWQSACMIPVELRILTFDRAAGGSLCDDHGMGGMNGVERAFLSVAVLGALTLVVALMLISA